MYVFAACIHASLYFTEYVRSIYRPLTRYFFRSYGVLFETFTEYVCCLGLKDSKLIVHYYIHTHYWPSHVEGI